MLLYVQVGTGDHTQLHASLYGHEKTKVANGKVLKAFQAAESFPYIAPYQWRHACLDELKVFLKGEVLAGRFAPQFQGGLD